MLDLGFVARLQYLASGKFDSARFSAGTALLLTGSCLTGVTSGLLCSAVANIPVISHLTVLVPIAACVSVAWFVAKFVHFSHCRNSLLAAFIGATCGVFTFLSACHVVGSIATMRETPKTTVLAAFTRTDQIKRAIFGRAFGPVLREEENEVYSGFNMPESMMLLIEVGILIWIPVQSARRYARRAYGEAIDRWLDRSIIRAVPGSGDRIVSVLEAGDFLVDTLSSTLLSPSDPRPSSSKFPRSSRSKKTTGDIAATWMLLEVSPFPAANGAYEAYLTATEIEANGKTRPLFHQLKLRSHEIAAARKLFLDSPVNQQVREVRGEFEQSDVVMTGRHVGETVDKSVLHGI